MHEELAKRSKIAKSKNEIDYDNEEEELIPDFDGADANDINEEEELTPDLFQQKMKDVGAIEMDLSSDSADVIETVQAIILVYPFPDEKIETIASLSYGEVAQPYKKTSNKVTFCKIDFESLNPGEWLKDTVVDGWMQW
jgi:Ulp1 family protease